MSKRDEATNRNGVVGAYGDFAPEKRTMSEIVAHIVERKKNPDAPIAKSSVEVARSGGFSLVRYRLGSDELLRDLAAAGGGHHSTSEHADIRAFLGVLDAQGRPQLLLDIIDDGDGPQISFAIPIPDATLPADVALSFLEHIDVPASWRCGADSQLADLFDAQWIKGMGWELQEPRDLVKVEFERICFATKPAMREAVDIFLVPWPGQDIADPDPDKAYWAKDFYRGRAWGEFENLPQSGGVRPGFSSWLNSGEPVLVKVLNASLDKDIARQIEARKLEMEDAPSPKA